MAEIACFGSDVKGQERDNVRTVAVAWAEHLFAAATAGCTPLRPVE